MNKASYPIHKSKKDHFTLKVPIRLVNLETGQSLNLIGRIDTGSDYCNFPSMISRTIGLVLDEKSLCEYGSRGISGVSIPTHKHWARIDLLDPTRTRVLRSLTLIINTLENKEVPPLIGVKMFLDQFKMTSNFFEDILDLEW